MAKVKGALFSLKASGKLADSLVYMSWKGIDDVRMYVVPANPRTEKQQAQRSKMTAAVNEFHAASYNSADKAAWDLYATTLQSAMSGFNAMIREHIKTALEGKTWIRLNHAVISTPSAGQITVEIESPEDATAKLYYGTSKSYLPNEVSGTYNAVLKKWTFQITGLASGVVYYFTIKNTADGKGGRTGIYYKLTT